MLAIEFLRVVACELVKCIANSIAFFYQCRQLCQGLIQRLSFLCQCHAQSITATISNAAIRFTIFLSSLFVSFWVFSPFRCLPFSSI